VKSVALLAVTVVVEMIVVGVTPDAIINQLD
jgi:hypothetical protein